VLLVTHDLGEALFLAERITLLARGPRHQTVTYRELLLEPADPFVSSFINAQRTLARCWSRRMRILLLALLLCAALCAQAAAHHYCGGLKNIHRGLHTR